MKNIFSFAFIIILCSGAAYLAGCYYCGTFDFALIPKEIKEKVLYGAITTSVLVSLFFNN